MGCCGLTYWCVGGVPTGVSAGPGGVYAKPPGAESGPYATIEEAYVNCSPPPQFLDMCCEDPIPFPRRVTIYLKNKTGIYRDQPFYPDKSTITLTANGHCSAQSCHWDGDDNYFFQVQFFCAGDNKFLKVGYHTCSNRIILSGDSFWTRTIPALEPPTVGAGHAFVGDYLCGQDLSAAFLNAHSFLGTYTAVPSSCAGEGTMEVHLFWE